MTMLKLTTRQADELRFIGETYEGIGSLIVFKDTAVIDPDELDALAWAVGSQYEIAADNAADDYATNAERGKVQIMTALVAKVRDAGGVDRPQTDEAWESVDPSRVAVGTRFRYLGTDTNDVEITSIGTADNQRPFTHEPIQYVWHGRTMVNGTEHTINLVWGATDGPVMVRKGTAADVQSDAARQAADRADAARMIAEREARLSAEGWTRCESCHLMKRDAEIGADGSCASCEDEHARITSPNYRG